jgi:hypothetical protein
VAHQFGELLQQIPAVAVSEDLGDVQQEADASRLAPEEAIVSDDALVGLQTGEEKETRQAGQQRPPEQLPDGRWQSKNGPTNGKHTCQRSVYSLKSPFASSSDSHIASIYFA